MIRFCLWIRAKERAATSRQAPECTPRRQGRVLPAGARLAVVCRRRSPAGVAVAALPLLGRASGIALVAGGEGELGDLSGCWTGKGRISAPAGRISSVEMSSADLEQHRQAQPVGAVDRGPESRRCSGPCAGSPSRAGPRVKRGQQQFGVRDGVARRPDPRDARCPGSRGSVMHPADQGAGRDGSLRNAPSLKTLFPPACRTRQGGQSLRGHRPQGYCGLSPAPGPCRCSRCSRPGAAVRRHGPAAAAGRPRISVSRSWREVGVDVERSPASATRRPTDHLRRDGEVRDSPGLGGRADIGW